MIFWVLKDIGSEHLIFFNILKLPESLRSHILDICDKIFLETDFNFIRSALHDFLIKIQVMCFIFALIFALIFVNVFLEQSCQFSCSGYLNVRQVVENMLLFEQLVYHNRRNRD